MKVNYSIVMKKYLMVMVFYVISTGAVNAQQTPVYSHYYLNPFLINPGFVGANSYTQAFGFYRKQWIGMPGAPETQAFSVDGPLNHERMGMGLIAYNDVINIIGRTGAYLAYAYHLPITESQKIRFGMAGGVMQNRIFFDKIRADDPYEDVILRNLDQGSTIDGSFGLVYEVQNFRLGLASHQLFQNRIRYTNETDFKGMRYTLVRHFISTMSYNFKMSNELTLEPLILAKGSQGMPFELDANAIVRYKDFLWMGLSYKHKVGVDISMGLMVDDKFIFSYGYEVATNGIGAQSMGSHEVAIGYRFPRKKSSIKASSGEGYSESDNRVVRKLEKENKERADQLDQLEQEYQKVRQELLKVTQQMETYKKEIRQKNKESRELKDGIKADRREMEKMIHFYYRHKQQEKAIKRSLKNLRKNKKKINK
jgi:type IX secretion system PorP/SprF family membrane protein